MSTDCNRGSTKILGPKAAAALGELVAGLEVVIEPVGFVRAVIHHHVLRQDTTDLPIVKRATRVCVKKKEVVGVVGGVWREEGVSGGRLLVTSGATMAD